MDAIGCPARIFVSSGAMGQLHDDVAAGHIHDEDVEIPWFKSTSPSKRDLLAIGVPRRIHGVALSGGQTRHIRSINTHSIYLRSAAAPRDKHQVLAGLGIYFRFHFERSGMGDALQVATVEIGLVNLGETAVGGGVND